VDGKEREAKRRGEVTYQELWNGHVVVKKERVREKEGER